MQTIVAEYNRISARLSETPKDHRPRFTRIDGQTFDIFDWDISFLLGTEYALLFVAGAARPARPAVTGDIIAAIRKYGEAKRTATCQDAGDVAEALNIRTCFMPKRAKQKY